METETYPASGELYRTIVDILEKDPAIRVRLEEYREEILSSYACIKVGWAEPPKRPPRNPSRLPKILREMLDPEPLWFPPKPFRHAHDQIWPTLKMDFPDVRLYKHHHTWQIVYPDNFSREEWDDWHDGLFYLEYRVPVWKGMREVSYDGMVRHRGIVVLEDTVKMFRIAGDADG